MEIIYTITLSLGSLAILFILTKIMGNREISQLSMFDYINGITIGSIGAEMATALEDFRKPLVAMIVYALVTMFISYATSKSIKLRRFLTGRTIRLYDNGKIYISNLKKAHLDLGEFLTQCRVAGFFDISQLQSVVLEPNGRMSFLPKSIHRPVTPDDINITPTKEKPLANVILDGKIMYENLEKIEKDEIWLKEELANQSIRNISEIFLATCDVNNNLCAYKKIETKIKHDIFD